MSARTLTITTPEGVFTRKTSTRYAFAVVWRSPRAMAAFLDPKRSESQMEIRWKKDRGFGVTWHTSHDTASRAARGSYCCDRAAVLVGIFALDGVTGQSA